MKKILFLIFALCYHQLAVSQFNLSDYSFNTDLDFNGVPIGGKHFFAGYGKAITNYKNDRVVMVGQEDWVVRVARIYSDGSYDTTFHDGANTTKGLAEYTIDGSIITVTCVTVDKANDLIYIGGYSEGNLRTQIRPAFILSIRSDGSPNKNFGVDGVAFIGVGTAAAEKIFDIGIQYLAPNKGKIIVAGSVEDPTTGVSHLVARFNPDGKVDADFTSATITSNDIASGSFGSMDISILDEIVLGSSTKNIVKLNSNGSLHKNFNGKVTPGLVSLSSGLRVIEQISDVVFYPGGKIAVLMGHVQNYKIMMLLEDGQADLSFNAKGTKGYYEHITTSEADSPLFLILDKYKNLIAVGISHDANNTNYYSAIRVLKDGTWDSYPERLPDGPVNPQYTMGGAILAPDERLMIAGTSSNPRSMITKVHTKSIHSYDIGTYPTKYVGGAPFYVPEFYSDDYKAFYNSTKPGVAYFTGRKVTIRDEGITYLRVLIPGDSAYYPFIDSVKLTVEAKPPVIIIGNSMVPEGTQYITFECKPHNRGGYWEARDLFNSDNITTIFELTRLSTDSTATFFLGPELKDAIITYRFTDISKNEVIIEKPLQVLPRTEGSADISQDVECSQELVSCAGNFIEHFRLNTLANDSSGCGMGGYNDFTASGKTTHMFLGEIYTAKIKSVTHSSATPAYIGLWIDYNNNGDFSDPEDYIISDFADPSNFKSIKMSIRNDKSYAGSRRLRVRYRTTPIHSTDACQLDGEAGETEDYLIILKEQESLQGPNLVTPNEDGKNDYLTIRGINSKYPDKRLVIFDRLGDVKYSNDNYENNWDGKNNKGELLSKGTYYYVFTNGENSIRGFFELVY